MHYQRKLPRIYHAYLLLDVRKKGQFNDPCLNQNSFILISFCSNVINSTHSQAMVNLKKSKMNLNFTKFTSSPCLDCPLDLPSCVNPPPFPAFAAAAPAASAAPPAAAQAAAAAREAASAQAAAGSNATVPAWSFQDGWVNCWSNWHSCWWLGDNFHFFPRLSKSRFPFPKLSFLFWKSHHTSTTSHHSDVWGLDTWAMKIHAILLDWRMNNAFRCDSVVIIPTTKQFIHLHKSSNQFVLSQLNLLQLPSRKLR